MTIKELEKQIALLKAQQAEGFKTLEESLAAWEESRAEFYRIDCGVCIAGIQLSQSLLDKFELALSQKRSAPALPVAPLQV